MYQYAVQFDPPIDNMRLRSKLLHNLDADLGRRNIFDGAILCLPHKLPEKVTLLTPETIVAVGKAGDEYT